MKGFSGFKNSPLKQSSVLDPESGIPWASKKDYPKKPNLVNLGKTNYMKVDISTKEGKDIVTRYKNTPTIRSSNPSRVTTKATNLGKDVDIIHKEINRLAKGGTPKGKQVAKKAEKLWRPFGPGTRPLHPNVTKGLKTFGKSVGVVGAITGAYDVFKGYGKLAKTKHGKQIIKDARMMPGKI